MHYILQNLKCFNFWQYEKVDLDFSRLSRNALVFVEGINSDAIDAASNYSGKTTLIVDLFRWIVGGKYDRLDKIDDVIGKFDTWTSGEIVFSVNKSILKITRYRNHPKHKNKLIVDWKGKKNITDRVVESEEMFEQIIGISINRFLYGVLFTNDVEYELLLKKPAERNRVLGDIWGLNLYSDASKLSSKICSNTDKELLEVNNSISLNVQLKSKVEKNIKQIKDDLYRANEEYNNTISEINTKREKATEIMGLRGSVLEEIDGTKSQIKATNDSLLELKRRLHDSQPIEDDVSKTKNKIELLNDRKKMLQNEIDGFNKEIAEVIKDKKKGMMCLSCGSIVSDKGIVNLIARRKTKIRKIKFKMSKVDEVIQERRKKLAVYSRLLSNYDTKENLVQITNASNKAIKLNKKLAEYQSALKTIDTAGVNIRKLDYELKDVGSYKKKYMSRLADEQKELAGIESELVLLKKSARSLKNKFKIYKFWAKGFKVFRNLTLKSHVKMMDIELNKHLNHISEGSIAGKWKLSNSGDVIASFTDEIDGQKKSFKGFSSAQRSKVLLSQCLCSAVLSAPDIGILILDEKLDLGLDSVGMNIVLQYLHSLRLGKRIFISSHRGDVVKSYCESTLRVTRADSKAKAQLILHHGMEKKNEL